MPVFIFSFPRALVRRAWKFTMSSPLLHNLLLLLTHFAYLLDWTLSFVWKNHWPPTPQSHPGISVIQSADEVALALRHQQLVHIDAESVEWRSTNPLHSPILERPLGLWVLSSWKEVLTPTVKRLDCHWFQDLICVHLSMEISSSEKGNQNTPLCWCSSGHSILLHFCTL